MSHITLTIPLRLMILHLSQIFLTDARTFMVYPFASTVSKKIKASSEYQVHAQ